MYLFIPENIFSEKSLKESMLLIIRNKVDEGVREIVSADLGGYTRVVVDVRRKILAAGGELRIHGKKLLMEDGSKQSDLWGGSIDFKTGDINFDSVINVRPKDGNRSREVLDKKIRKQMESIITNLLGRD